MDLVRGRFVLDGPDVVTRDPGNDKCVCLHFRVRVDSRDLR